MRVVVHADEAGDYGVACEMNDFRAGGNRDGVRRTNSGDSLPFDKHGLVRSCIRPGSVDHLHVYRRYGQVIVGNEPSHPVGKRPGSDGLRSFVKIGIPCRRILREGRERRRERKSEAVQHFSSQSSPC